MPVTAAQKCITEASALVLPRLANTLYVSRGCQTNGAAARQHKQLATDSYRPGRELGSLRECGGSAAVTNRTQVMATRRYGRASGRKVRRAMHEMKRGKLRSGRSGRKVKSRKQAIAIGLSEARRSGAKVPRRKR